LNTSRPDDETKFAPNRPGVFNRGACKVQHWIMPGSDFLPEPNRYHLFINYGCGWSHQAMLTLAVKGLLNVVSLSHLGLTRLGKNRSDPDYRGWSCPADPTGNGFKSAFDIYNAASDYGREQMTIPILFDKKTKRVVSNDPAHILMMFNASFQEWAENKEDLYPPELQEEIEAVNAVIYPGVNDGVYRCWFASEEAYKESARLLAEAFVWMEKRVTAEGDFLVGHRLTLADLRAFPHFFRFDVIYHKLMLKDPRGPYLKETNPNTIAWMERLYSIPAIKEMSDLEVAARFYLSEPDAECDVLHEKLKEPWMQTAEELLSKRQKQGLVVGACFKPTEGADLGAPV